MAARRNDHSQIEMQKEEILKALAEVQHPAKGDRDIVALGLVEDAEFSEGKIRVTLAFPKHRDPLADYLCGSARAALARHFPGVEAELKTIVKDEVPAKKKAGLDLGTEELEKVSHIIGIASGKGGVGKSTVAVNLAVPAEETFSIPESWFSIRICAASTPV